MTMELQVDLHKHLLKDRPLNVADLRFLQQSFVTMVMVMMIMREKQLSYFIHATFSENDKPIKLNKLNTKLKHIYIRTTSKIFLHAPHTHRFKVCPIRLKSAGSWQQITESDDSEINMMPEKTKICVQNVPNYDNLPQKASQ